MEPFIGEIRIFAGDFPPNGWAFCDGRLLPISQNMALFSILNTTYGGNGQTTFALPNLRGAAPIMAGAGRGLSPRSLGERGGATAVTLTVKEMPNHSHVAIGNASAGIDPSPTDATWALDGVARGTPLYATRANKATPMSAEAMKPAGEGLPHNNMPSYLTLNFIIALQGVFPSRT
jgi:microcystin-dependent protein